jgi:hypothetical protein
MITEAKSKTSRIPSKRRIGRGCLRGCLVCVAGVMALFLVAAICLIVVLRQVPKSYPPAARPLSTVAVNTNAGGGLDGFDSPYLGHTGSWNGAGGAMGGGSKIPDLEKERRMGLRWTFMPVYWRAMEPNGPVDLNRETPPAWKALDDFVIAAQQRGLNVLMQAPVVGGNAGGPPAWAGRREAGKSAPANMDGLAEFARKLADRYRPGGTLAQHEGWGECYGVRAWELDNEPESYRTHWNGQAADYAEFVTRSAARIKAADPQAVIVAPGLAAGRQGLKWLEQTLDAARSGSPAFQAQGKPYSIGPVVDVVSLHNYEGLDSFFSGGSRTIGQVLDDVGAVFEKWEQRSPGFSYERKQNYWHTEGNFDFVGVLSAERRAAWRIQFFTRAFAAGLRKVCVMDASAPEQTAVRAYVRTLPWPFPMEPADADVIVRHGTVSAFRHRDTATEEAGQIWVLWAAADSGDAQVEVPIEHEHVKLLQVDGSETVSDSASHRLTVELKGDRKMAPPLIIVDRPAAMNK